MPEFVTRDEWAKRVEHGGLPAARAATEQTPPLDVGLRKFGSLGIVKQDVDPSTGMMDVTFVISTSALDRDSDIVDVDGWELQNYLANPVVLWAHNYSQPPVGVAQSVWMEDGKLLATDRFTPQEINPFGHMVYQMVRGRFLRATSVGFRPIEYVLNDDHKGYDFNRQELLEHSIVPVPANPEALQAASAEGIDLAPLKTWAEEILDTAPDEDGRVRLWLPRATVEQVHAAVTGVVVGLKAPDTQDPADTGETAPEAADATGSEPVGDDASADAGNIELDNEGSGLMKEAIQALSAVVRELRDVVERLPEQVASKLDDVARELQPQPPEPPAEQPTEEPPAAPAEAAADDATEKATEDEEEVSIEDATAIIREVAEQVALAKTGRLPN